MNRKAATFVETIDGHGRQPSFSNDTGTSGPDEIIQMMFETSPGNGTWEVTFHHDKESGKISTELNQISRTNKYGSDPHCIQEQFPYLRPFCYCNQRPNP